MVLHVKLPVCFKYDAAPCQAIQVDFVLETDLDAGISISKPWFEMTHTKVTFKGALS